MDQNGADTSKSLLILKANPASLATSEMFLRNRGWAVYTTGDVKEALMLLLQKKYNYILISVDHPNKKIKMLPKLISYKFKVGVMTFAETQSAGSYNLLNASESEYKVYAPVTGPAIERAVLKYDRDQQTMNLFSGLNSGSASTNSPTFNVEPMDEGDLLFRQSTKDPQDEVSVFVRNKKTVPSAFGHVHVTAQDAVKAGKVRAETPPAQKRSETLIARATEKSMIGNLDIEDGLVHHKVHGTTQSGCILVQSERFSGYLVTAMGFNKLMDDNLLNKIKTTLFKFLSDNGETVTENDTLNLKLKPVDFEPWAQETAEFLRKSVHNGDEVAIAFFPRRPVNIRLEDGIHPNMAKIKLNDLVGDAKVEFNLYLHLAANNRYVLYTPQGGVFYTNQLDRLKKQGVTHMHVKKEDLEAITKYNAQNYINGLVDAYQEKHQDERRSPEAL